MNFVRSYLRKHKKLLIISLLLATTNQVFSLVNPQIFRLIIDNYATKISELTQSDFLEGVVVLLLIGVGAAAISRIAKTFQDYYVNLMSQKIGARIYADGIAHTFSLPYRVFEDRQSGALLDKLQKARNDLQKFLSSLINTVFLSLIGMIIVIIYAFYVHRGVGVAYLIMLPILAFTTLQISNRIRSAQQHIVTTSAELAGATTENIRNVTLIKSLGLEHQEINHLNTVNDRLIALEIEKLKLIKTLTFTQGTLINFLRSCLQLLMLWLVYRQVISLGEFFTLLFYSFLIFNPLYELPAFATSLQETKASNTTLQAIHAMQPEPDLSDAPTLDHIERIEFAQVDFSYSDEHPALQDISFTVKAGQTIAFVGPSGAGKSTILKLLSGLYHPTSGKIYFNQLLSHELNRPSLKQHFGIVAQDTQLFSGSVRDNLLFVQPDATDRDCLGAMQQAQLIDLIEDHPQGLDALIGEGGLKLSGGQKQRLAIARALLRNPSILIFDEATSSLDSLIESQITDTIQQIVTTRPDLITILVAHRLSTIMHADHIYVLEQGSIVESGSHTSLLSQGGLYAALWRQQSGAKLELQ